MYLERLFCFTHQTQLDLQHGGHYLVIIDREFSDVTALYLYVIIIIIIIIINYNLRFLTFACKSEQTDWFSGGKAHCFVLLIFSFDVVQYAKLATHHILRAC